MNVLHLTARERYLPGSWRPIPKTIAWDSRDSFVVPVQRKPAVLAWLGRTAGPDRVPESKRCRS